MREPTTEHANATDNLSRMLALHSVQYRRFGGIMNYDYNCDAAVADGRDTREPREGEIQDWALLFAGLAC
ncbi:hypothetical protein [Bifidobacterium olomucense]|uniref:Uncharacterized protein n=1 Tax=Bifidobacterium olomucense TaxID=2675324 RepID=A0A7Y0EY38_9BIFI|nr:hypothetical protein [Bifidobacterium sp. DSM 109959]NMM98543.1 hypothetical protein [Bifidobacterium sp. DSM 109959]